MKITLGGHEYELLDGRDAFIDPKTLTVYEWPVNHSPDGDEGGQKQRAITETANSGNVGLVRQQGADQGVTLKRSGAILTVAHEQAFWHWFKLCEGQTIYFVEFDGVAFEVQIITYDPKKIGSGGPSKNGLGYYVKYTMELAVFNFLAGPAFAAGVTP